MPKNTLETQVGGDHYSQYPIQPLDFCYENEIPHVDASAIVYIVRHREKGGAEDLMKAKHLIDYLLEKEYGV